MEFNLFPKFIDEAASPPAQAVGNTVSELWGLAIGNHVSLWTQKQTYKQQINFQSFKERIEEKTQAIPEENIREPLLHILGPAIEASKYYIESEDLREMFANLISSSIDDRKSRELHPSFVEIIKQLSPLDAKVLANYKKTTELPLVQLRVAKETGEYITTHEHIMNFNDKMNYRLQVSSLSNLNRLGLLYINYSTHSANLMEYEFIATHPAYNDATQRLNELKEIGFSKVIIQKGLSSRTPLCEDFVSSCM